MITTTSMPAQVREQSLPLLPEPLAESAYTLAALDAAAAAILLLAGHFAHHGRAVLLALLALGALGYLSGRYRRSFATVPRDEIYATLAFALPALVLALLLSPLLHVSPAIVVVTAALWSVAACAGAVAVCARRRGSTPRHIGICYRVDHIGRTRSRSVLLRWTIDTADVVLAAIGAIVLSPVLLLCALAVAWDDGFPVIFTQTRVGQNDREFVILKFRTLCREAGASWVTPSDQRVTRVGRFLRRTSLDELPQLFNVLRREMSLVGPRPEMCEYADDFAQRIPDYPDRHLVPPGITGWAQLNFKRNLSPDEARDVLRYDLYYARHRSLPLYAYCLVKTACEVVFHTAV